MIETCELLKAPENGKVTYCSGIGITDGDTCFISCDAGYDQIVQQRTCKSDGSWSGKVIACRS